MKALIKNQKNMFYTYVIEVSCDESKMKSNIMSGTANDHNDIIIRRQTTHYNGICVQTAGQTTFLHNSASCQTNMFLLMSIEICLVQPYMAIHTSAWQTKPNQQ